jgi:hypothetical protein
MRSSVEQFWSIIDEATANRHIAALALSQGF